MGVSFGMRPAILKQSISAVLACSVQDATQDPISHALADPAAPSGHPPISALHLSLMQLPCIVFLPSSKTTVNSIRN